MVKFILGPMKSGKTTRLFSEMEKFVYANKEVLFIYPEFSKREKLSRNGDKILESVSVYSTTQTTTEKELYDNAWLAKKWDAIFVDEAQFISTELLTLIIKTCLANNRSCYISALNSDYQGRMWASIIDTFHYATNIEMLNSVCDKCGSFEGTHSWRKEDGKGQVVIGDNNYKTLCDKCFEELS